MGSEIMGKDQNFDGELPDWLRDDDDDSSPEEKPKSPSERKPSDQTGPATPSRLGVTGALPWRQGASDPASRPGQTSGLSDIDWNTLGDARSDEAAPEAPINTGDLNWRRGSEPQAGAPSAAGQEALPDWLSDDTSPAQPTSAAPMNTGDLAWRRGGESPAETPSPRASQETNLPDWLTGGADFSDSSASSFDMTTASAGLDSSDDADDWLTASSDPYQAPDAGLSQPSSPPVSSWQDENQLPDWLDDSPGFAAPVSSQAEESTDAENLDDLLFGDDLAVSSGDFNFDDAFDESASATNLAPPADTNSLKGIRKIAPRQSAPLPPEAEPPKSTTGKIQRLGKPGAEKPTGDLTFEQWERQQQQQQYETDHADELALEAEVPDWFRDNVEIGDAANDIASILMPDIEEAPAEPELPRVDTGKLQSDYAPDWFLGLEEQNLEDAPDWIKAAREGAADTGSLLDASAFAPPEPEVQAPPPVEETPSDVPDWFMGLGADLPGEEANWMAAFDTPAAPAAEPKFDFSDMASEVEAPTDAPEFDFSDIVRGASTAPPPTPAPKFDFPDLASTLSAEPEFDFSDMATGIDTSAPESDFDFSELVSAAAASAAQSDFSDMDDALVEPEFTFGDLSNSDVMQEESPGWLQGYETPAAPAGPAQPAAQFEAEEDISSSLDWLSDIGGADFSTSFEDEAAVAAAKPVQETAEPRLDLRAAPGVDDLLGMREAPVERAPVSRRQAEIAASPSAEGLEDLFADVDQSFLDVLDKRATSAMQPAVSEQDADDVLTMMTEGQELIDHLRPDEQIKLRAGGLEIDFEQQGLAYLPEDLQELREQTLSYVREKPAASSTPISSGPLAGITGGLDIKAIQPGQLELATHLDVPEAQSERIDLLAVALEVVNAEDEEAEAEEEERPHKVRRRSRVKRKLDRFVVSLILLAALIAPFATDTLHFADKPTLQGFASEQQSVVSAITSLPPGARVLMAFEYGPTAAGELNGLAEAVLRDLLRQRAVPVVLSTNPLGALNARQLLQELGEDEALLDALERDEPLIAGQDYFALRYVAGGAVAIRGLTRGEVLSNLVFSTDSTGEKTNLDIGRITADDFAMVLVVGENLDDVRNWAEQFPVPGLPKYALVTAAAEPLVNAYVDTGGDLAFLGYLAGYRDAYRYDHLRNAGIREPLVVPDDVDIPDPEISQWHSMAFGVLVASLLVLLGMVINTLRGLRRRK